MGCAASGPAGSDGPSPQAQGAQRNSREDATNRGSSSAVDPIRLQRGQVRRGAESLELEGIIDDTFAFDFVLAHAESEFSSENIEFLIELRKLLQLQPSDKGLFKLSQKILKTHVQVGAELEVNLPPEVKTALLAWLKSSLSDGMIPPPMQLWKQAHMTAFRSVKFDVFPRFRTSPLAEELVALRLGRCMPSERFRNTFAGDGSSVEFSPQERAAWAFLADAHNYATQYETLASGWPSDESVRRAAVLYKQHAASFDAFGVPSDTRTQMKRLVPEAPISLFQPALTPAHNILASVYRRWLETDAGAAFCRDMFGLTPTKRTKAAGKLLDSTEDYLNGW